MSFIPGNVATQTDDQLEGQNDEMMTILGMDLEILVNVLITV